MVPKARAKRDKTLFVARKIVEGTDIPTVIRDDHKKRAIEKINRPFFMVLAGRLLARLKKFQLTLGRGEVRVGVDADLHLVTVLKLRDFRAFLVEQVLGDIKG